MKTGLGLYRKYRLLLARLNLLRFWLRKAFIGFDVANLFLQRVDKYSVQLILKRFGAKIGDDCDIETGQIFHNCKNYSNLIIGNNCHIGKNCFFDLRDKLHFGCNVVVSMKSSFITHIDMSKSKLSYNYPILSKPIFIRDNTYIGANSTILMGVEAEKNSFIAAGAVVVKKVETNTMVAGIPARYIKKLDNILSEE